MLQTRPASVLEAGCKPQRQLPTPLHCPAGSHPNLRTLLHQEAPHNNRSSKQAALRGCSRAHSQRTTSTTRTLILHLHATKSLSWLLLKKMPLRQDLSSTPHQHDPHEACRITVIRKGSSGRQLADALTLSLLGLALGMGSRPPHATSTLMGSGPVTAWWQHLHPSMTRPPLCWVGLVSGLAAGG